MSNGHRRDLDGVRFVENVTRGTDDADGSAVGGRRAARRPRIRWPALLGSTAGSALAESKVDIQMHPRDGIAGRGRGVPAAGDGEVWVFHAWDKGEAHNHRVMARRPRAGSAPGLRLDALLWLKVPGVRRAVQMRGGDRNGAGRSPDSPPSFRVTARARAPSPDPSR